MKGHRCRDTDPGSLGGQPEPQGPVSLSVSGLVRFPQGARPCDLLCGTMWERCLRGGIGKLSVRGPTVNL